MSKVQEAVECFNNGFNCSQAVFSTYCEQFGLDRKSGLKIAGGFGGGMGRQGEICGAITGAYMLIGLKHGKSEKADDEAREKTYELVQEFSHRFRERNRYIGCRELLGVDIMIGDKNILNEKFKVLCPQMVRDAAEILEEIMEIK